METGTTNVYSNERPLERRPVAHSSFARDERGQISVLVILCIIPFIFLVAFIFNSAKQTTRKIEMQGAADSAAVASAVTMARGMNLMVLNNNSMADILALMIVIRSVANTVRFLFRLHTALAIFNCIAGAYLNPECDYQTALALNWYGKQEQWDKIDDALNKEYDGFGWKIMKALDEFNKLIKVSFPGWAIYQAAAYAHKNTADQFPYGFVLPGKSDGAPIGIGDWTTTLPIPTFPVARGPAEAIADQAYHCQFGVAYYLIPAALFVLFGGDGLDMIVGPLLYEVLVQMNFVVLGGGPDWLRDIASSLQSFAGSAVLEVSEILTGIHLLRWSTDENKLPRPMLLTDNPSRDPTTEKDLEDAEKKVTPYLSYLGFALGKVPLGSPIGGQQFLNKPNMFLQVQFAFGQANVYNPSKWDMWTQDWRAHLRRSKLFDEKVNSIIEFLGFEPGKLAPDWSFVNAH
jgi:hypothetical protein